MRTRFAILLLLGLVPACGGSDLGSGFGVALTLATDSSLSASALATVKRVSISVSGDESETENYDFDRPAFASGKETLHFRPLATSRHIDIAVSIADGSGTVIGHGDSGTLALVEGRQIAETITLGAGGNPGSDGGVGALAFSGSSDFGTIAVGGSGAPVPLTLTNGGSVTTGALTTSIAPTGEFTIVSDACSGQTLAAGASCIVQVQFAPTASGSRSATLTATAAPGGSASLALVGQATDSVTLTVHTNGGAGGGSVSATGLSCSGTTCTGSYPGGTVVTLTAVADSSSIFVGWTDGACSGSGTCVMTMNAAQSVTARFEPAVVSLNLGTSSVGGASGTVSPSNPGASCGVGTSGCSSYPYATKLSITATPTAGYYFAGWSGACSGFALSCAVQMTQTLDVIAHFAPANRMFVTSTTYTPGALAGLDPGGDPLAYADSECQARAAAANLPGHYVAILSTSKVNGLSRVGNARGWVRIDGKPFADSAGDLKKVVYPPRLTEAGTDLGTNTVFSVTGLDGDGTSDPQTCSDYNDTSGTTTAGLQSEGAFGWFASTGLSCDTPARLNCLQTDYAVTITYAKATGRAAFVSQYPFVISASTNMAAADKLCSDEAKAAGLPGTYLAVLAGGGQSAASRFDLTGPLWVRTDGVPLASTTDALFGSTGMIDVPIEVEADGVTRLSAAYVWTGATSGQTAASDAQTCGGWADPGNGTTTTLVGQNNITIASEHFYVRSDIPCNSANNHLYCLQQ